MGGLIRNLFSNGLGESGDGLSMTCSLAFITDFTVGCSLLAKQKVLIFTLARVSYSVYGDMSKSFLLLKRQGA